ncbi:MAG: hypothetical protein SFZ02_00685 [bacterium]|nr:hypothetical protein [bacterium]
MEHIESKRGRSFMIMTFISVGVILAISLDLSEWLRGGFGWRWGYGRVPLLRVLVLALLVLGYLVIIWQLQRRRLWLLFGGVIIGSSIIAFGTAYLRDGDALFTMLVRTLSPGATAPHAVGALIDWSSDMWRDWSMLMPNLPRHVALSPPGAPLWYGFLEGIFNNLPSVSEALRAPLFPYQCHVYFFTDYTPAEWATAWFGITMPLWAGFIVIPLYATAKTFFSDDVARRIIIAWALVPSMALWAGSWNSLYPFIAITSFFFLHLGITYGAIHGIRRRRTLGYLYLSGLLAGIGSFINFAFMPMFLLFGLYTLMTAFWGKKPIKSSRLLHAELVGIVFGIGMFTIWGVYWLITRETPFEILNVALNDHLELPRNYWFWLVMHVWDWVLFAGVMWALLSLYGLFRGLRTRERGAIPPILLLNGALWLTVLITTISNTARGETARVWSWMTPFLLLVAYDGITRLVNNPKERHLNLQDSWWVVNWVQALSVILLASHLSVFNTELPLPATRPEAIADVTPINASFTRTTDNATFHLTGWRGEYDADQNALILWLNWRSDQPIYDVLWFGATPVSPEGVAGDMVIWQPGEFVVNDDNPEKDMRYPTTCWLPNETPLGDMVVIPLPENASEGEWWVSIAIFGDEEQTEGRLLVSTAEGDGELQIGVGGILVP